MRSSSIIPRTSAALQKVAAHQLRTATAAAMAVPSWPAGSAPRRFPPSPLPDPRATDHRSDPVRNPDASRYFCAPGGGVLAPHDWCGRDGCSGNGDRLRVASVGALSRRSLRRNKYGRDRNGCRSVPGPGSPDTRTVAPAWHIGMVVAIPARLRGLRQMPWTQSLPGAMMPLHSCSGTV